MYEQLEISRVEVRIDDTLSHHPLMSRAFSFPVSRFDDMSVVRVVLLGTLLAVIGYGFRYVVHVYRSPLCVLRGPPSGRLLAGNIRQVGKVTDPHVAAKWINEYGMNCLTRWFLSVRAQIFCD